MCINLKKKTNIHTLIKNTVLLKHANHYLSLHWVIIFSLVVAANLHCVQNTVSVKLNKTRCAILALDGLTLLWALSQSRHLQREQVETGLRGSLPTVLFYVILGRGRKLLSKVHGFSMRWAFFKEETPCVLRFFWWEFIYTILPLENSRFYPPTEPSLAIKRSHEVW